MNKLKTNDLEIFLRKQRVWTKFKKNAKCHRSNRTSKILNIDMAFIWKGTPEGHDFWEKLRDEKSKR